MRPMQKKLSAHDHTIKGSFKLTECVSMIKFLTVKALLRDLNELTLCQFNRYSDTSCPDFHCRAIMSILGDL